MARRYDTGTSGAIGAAPSAAVILCLGGASMRILPLTATLAALTLPSPVLAQRASLTDATEEDANGTLVVTALPDPVAIDAYGRQTIDAAILQSSAAGTLEAALGQIAGFQQFRRSDSRSANVSAQGITLRGLGGNASSRTLLLRDGVPVADAFFGFIPFTALPLEDVARVRVTRGSGTGPFGAGALTGVIEVETMPLSRQAPIAAAVAGGSRNSWQGDVALVRTLGAGHVAISAHHDRGDGFFTTPTEQRVAASVPSRYRASSASIGAAVPVNAGLALTARIDLFRDDRTLRFAGADSSAEGVDASLRLIGSGRWQWDALGWVQARDFSNIVVSATSFRPTLDQRDTPTTGWGAKFELRPPVGGNRTLRIGFDLRGADGVAIEDALLPDGVISFNRRAGGTSFGGGLFAEGDAALGPFAVTIGGRIDSWRLTDGGAFESRGDGTVTRNDGFADRSGTLASVRGGVSVSIDPHLTLRIAGYTGFRLPTLNELYRGFTVFPVVTRANPLLEPERLRGVEIGAEWRPLDALTFSVTGFDNRLRDAIANVTIGNNLRERRNIAAVSARGVEALASVDSGDVRATISWAYSDARMRVGEGDAAARALDGLRPAQSASHSGSVALGWRFADQALAQLSLRHTGAQFEDDRNIDRLRAATTLDAFLRLPLMRRLAVELRGENLFDVDVVTRNSAGSIDLGTPRTIWLGLRWQ